MNENQALKMKSKSILPIATCTANGDLYKLEITLEEGLAAGLIVNEIQEMLVHLNGYTGLSEVQMQAFLTARKEKVGKNEFAGAKEILDQVLSNKV